VARGKRRGASDSRAAAFFFDVAIFGRIYDPNAMPRRQITIRVSATLAARIKKAAGRLPISAWAARVIEERLDDADHERMWREFHGRVRPRAVDVKRADEIFEKITRPSRNAI
jgi:hypothetical protein